jgi:mono/diheme cytochrome c family protein
MLKDVTPMYRALTAVLVLTCWLAAPGTAAAEDPAEDRRMYLKYCGACHGPHGRGDGVAGTFMSPKPTDLTTIAKRNGGEFPFMRVVRIIDGRDTIRAHGAPDMPVWGEVLQGDRDDAVRRVEVRSKIMIITDYLRSIQAQ